MIKYFILFSLTALLSMETVKNLNINKFMGKWYVISIIPNFIENKAENSYDYYSLNSDGTIDISYHAIKKGKPIALKQRAHIVDKVNNSTWKLQFLKPFIPFFRAPFQVILLDEKYQYMAIGYPGNKYGWIMSRSNNMEEDLYNDILNILEFDFGYIKEKFVKVKHN